MMDSNFVELEITRAGVSLGHDGAHHRPGSVHLFALLIRNMLKAQSRTALDIQIDLVGSFILECSLLELAQLVETHNFR